MKRFKNNGNRVLLFLIIIVVLCFAVIGQYDPTQDLDRLKTDIGSGEVDVYTASAARAMLAHIVTQIRGPSVVSATVNPSFGPAGTMFTINISLSEHANTVDATIVDPSGSVKVELPMTNIDENDWAVEGSSWDSSSFSEETYTVDLEIDYGVYDSKIINDIVRFRIGDVTVTDLGIITDISDVRFSLSELGGGLFAVYKGVFIDDATSSYFYEPYSSIGAANFIILHSTTSNEVYVDLSAEAGISEVGLFASEWDFATNSWGDMQYFTKTFI